MQITLKSDFCQLVNPNNSFHRFRIFFAISGDEIN
jgi:hypothetical protein